MLFETLRIWPFIREQTIRIARGFDNHWGPLGIVLLLSFAVYAQTLTYEFVYDDTILYVKNSLIKEVQNIPVLVQQEDTFDGLHPGYYRPLIPLSYVIDYQLWGLNPAGLHFSNILFHLAATSLVYFIALRLFGVSSAAMIAALFFGLHPINTESVSFITGRNNILCTSFMLAAALSYYHYRSGGKVRWLAVFALVYLAGLCSKEFAIMLPFILFFSDAVLRQLDRKAWISLAMSVALILLYLTIRSAILDSAAGIKISIADVPHRLPGALDNFMGYLRLSVAPFGQKALYPETQPQVSIHLIILELVVLVGLLALMYHFRNLAWIAISVGWFVLSLAPALNVIPLSGSYFAERYLYVALPGIALMVGGLYSSWRGNRAYARIIRGCIILVLCMLSLLTVLRNPIWRNDETLYTDMVRTSPSAYKGWYLLIEEYRKQGRHDEAARYWKHLIEIMKKPKGSVESWSHLTSPPSSLQ